MRICFECGNALARQERTCPFCSHRTVMVNGHLAFAPELAEDNEGFEPENFAKLANWEPENFWFCARNRLLIWALGKYFPRAASFMEIGCGTGFVLTGIRQAFPRLKLAGSEIFSEGLLFASQRLPGVELFQMDARRIPFRDEFDVIGAFDVLEHIQEDELVLSQMHQALHMDGGLMLTVPHHPFLWSAVDVHARHVRRYKTPELRTKIESAGFRILRMTSFVSLLMPLLIVSRFRVRHADSELGTSEVSPSRLVNAVLERTLDLERTAIRGGLSLPAGGSLLVVAQRK